MIRIVIVFWMVAVAGSCNTAERSKRKAYKDVPMPELKFNEVQPTIVYKTKANYDTLVPVILSEDRSEIIAYPHPRDLLLPPSGDKPSLKKQYTLPVRMEGGYLLDNRGVGIYTAFLDMSYQEYSALAQPPSLAELKERILDSDPMTEVCDCGDRMAFKDVERQINKIIVMKKLRKDCRVLK